MQSVHRWVKREKSHEKTCRRIVSASSLRCDQTFTNDTAEQWDTSLLPLTHALYIQEMTSCWVSLGFGAQLAICICHFERVTLAYIYFYRRFIPSNHDLLVMRRCIIWALKHLQTERNDAPLLSALKKKKAMQPGAMIEIQNCREFRSCLIC